MHLAGRGMTEVEGMSLQKGVQRLARLQRQRQARQGVVAETGVAAVAEETNPPVEKLGIERASDAKGRIPAERQHRQLAQHSRAGEGVGIGVAQLSPVGERGAAGRAVGLIDDRHRPSAPGQGIGGGHAHHAGSDDYGVLGFVHVILQRAGGRRCGFGIFVGGGFCREERSDLAQGRRLGAGPWASGLLEPAKANGADAAGGQGEGVAVVVEDQLGSRRSV
ncbi:hypothetical protein D3C80_409880 [compost metagenome]